MDSILTLEQLNSLRQLLQAGKDDEFYRLQLNNGYDFAGWARSVAVDQ